MPKFSLFWIVTYSAGLVASFVNPVFGTYTYLFEYYLRPPLHWWGKGHLPDLRWNLIISLVLVSTYLLKRQSLPQIGSAPTGPAKFLIALGVLMLLMTPIAVSPELSWAATGQFLKLILFHGLIVGTVRTERAFDGFIAIHLAGAGWWGWEAYQNPNRDQGRLANVGSGDTLNDNFAAAHLLAVIPFIVVYLLVHKDKRLRGLALLVAPFVINTFILCNSRGSTVGLLVALAVGALIAKSGRRLRTIGAGLALALAFYVLSDPEFIGRQQTTSNYEEDGSAMDRIFSWQGGLRLIADYPFGAGGNGYEELSPIYIGDVVASNKGEKRAPHNTYILVTSDWGVLGLFLFLGYCFTVFRLIRQVRRRAPEGGIWYYRALAVELSLVGLMVASIFADRLYGEAPYWLGGLAVALHRLQTFELKQKETDQGEDTSSAGVREAEGSSVADYLRSHRPTTGIAR